ncbi:MAG TPA: hypothetical protein VMI31_02410 [Fimbriimonadaceae bacterium]|nr:hypothetical protein [Fimbriimonadaceae bacterium]
MNANRRRSTVRELLELFGVLGAALIGFEVCRLLTPKASILGPFLLVSPFLVLSSMAMAGLPLWPGRIMKETWEDATGGEYREPDQPLRDRVDRLSAKLGISAPEIAIKERGLVRFESGITPVDGKLLIYMDSWSLLDETDREFALAWNLASLTLKEPTAPRLFTVIGLPIGAFLAGFSPWLVLLLLPGAFGVWSWWVFRYARKRDFETDILAVRATSDVEGAKAYIRRFALGPTSREKRIAKLEALFDQG